MSSRPDFDRLMAWLDYPMFVVTVRVGDERDGCLVGFASQVSIEPGRFLVCLSNKNRTYELASAARHLAVHALAADAMDLAELFGGETGDEVDKLARVDHVEGPHGLPILTGCQSWFVGAVRQRLELGDHVGFLLEPEVVQHVQTGAQLTFHRARRIEPGHDP